MISAESMLKQELKSLKTEEILLFCGPTASGKSKLALDLARELNREIISADSMQIYRDMNIGTAKVTPYEQSLVKHHLLDFISPLESFSVADYIKLARPLIRKKQAVNQGLIICGGTGLYINALLDNLDFIATAVNNELRAKLQAEINASTCHDWHQKLSLLDPQYGKTIAGTDLRRIRRFFEVYQSCGKTNTEVNRESKRLGQEFKFKAYCLFPNREELYNKINQRTKVMFASGIIEETQLLLNKYPGIEQKPSFKAIGYNYCQNYLLGDMTLEQAINLTAQKTRNYAKRQYTWFKARSDLKFII